MGDMIKCPSCGKEIRATAKFCGFCATKIDEAVASETKAEVVFVDTKDEEKDSATYCRILDEIEKNTGVRGRSATSEKSEGKVCSVCGRPASGKAKFCGVCAGAIVDDVESPGIADVAKIKNERENDYHINHKHSDFKVPGDL